MNLFDYFGNMNVFAAGPNAQVQSLLDNKLIDQSVIDKANKQSIGTGLVTGLASYFAQPQNQNYGDVSPYIAKAFLNANKAAQAPFENIPQAYAMDTQIAENQRLQKENERADTQRDKISLVIDDMISKNPNLAYLKNAPDAQRLAAVEEYTKNKLTSTTAKAPTRSKFDRLNDNGTPNDPKDDYLETVTQQYDPTVGGYVDYNVAPKDIALDTLFEPQTIELLASQYVQTGQLPTLGRGKTGEQNRKAVYDEVAKMAKESGFADENGNVDISQYVADIQAQKQELRSSNLNLNRFDTGPQGNRVESLNVGIDHIDSFRKIVKSLNNNDFKDVNRLRNYFSKRYSNPELASFETAKPIISTEVAKGIIGGNVMTREDRAELQDTIEAAQSFDEINAALDTALIMLAGQLEGLQNQYESGLTKRTLERNPFDERLNKKTKDVLKEIREKYSEEPVDPDVISLSNPRPEDAKWVKLYRDNPNSATGKAIKQKLLQLGYNFNE